MVDLEINTEKGSIDIEIINNHTVKLTIWNGGDWISDYINKDQAIQIIQHLTNQFNLNEKK